MTVGHLFSVPPKLELSYSELRDHALAALADRDYRTARRFFDWAYLRAKQLANAELVDAAVCNRAALASETGIGDALVPELRRIAQEASAPGLCALAAYNLSRILSCAEAKDFARLAGRAAKRAGNPELLAFSNYRIGLEYLGECCFSLARRQMENAVESLAGLPGRQEEAALVASSIGYCLSMEGFPERARSALRRSEELVQASRSRTYTTDLRLNFGFTLLNIQEYQAAAGFAHQVLAEDCHRLDFKFGLYLAGSASAHLGWCDDAEYFFRLLQSEFYPDQPMVVDLLLAHPTHQLVNWLG